MFFRIYEQRGKCKLADFVQRMSRQLNETARRVLTRRRRSPVVGQGSDEVLGRMPRNFGAPELTLRLAHGTDPLHYPPRPINILTA